MSVTSILLVLLSASIHVWWNLLTKQSQSPKGFSLLKGTVLIGVAAMAVVSAPLREIPTNVVIKPSSLEIPLRSISDSLAVILPLPYVEVLST